MDGYRFEKKCAAMLRRQGFTHVTLTAGSGDQGVDILARKHHRTYGIQCKYYTHPVGNKAVQEAYAGARFYDCDIAAVMTNSTYTEAARALAERTGVLLWETAARGFGWRPHLWWLSAAGIAALAAAFVLLLRLPAVGEVLELLSSTMGLAPEGMEALPEPLAGLCRMEAACTAAGAAFCLWNRRSKLAAAAAAVLYLSAIGCEIAIRDSLPASGSRMAVFLLFPAGISLLAVWYLRRTVSPIQELPTIREDTLKLDK